MKIGLITYHNTLNFGAALQTYSLVSSLQGMGIDVEVIDYRNRQIESRKTLTVSRLRNSPLRTWPKIIVQFPAQSIKSAAFNRFASSHLNIGREVFRSPEEILQNPPVYDLYLIGSDQVWNFEINGLDTTYFLDFVQDKARTASFASSFGLSSIPVELRAIYSKFLSSFKHISVRESLGAELILNLSSRKALVHSDPVFLTEPSDWRALARSSASKSVEGALATYFLGPEARKKADEIISTSSLQSLKVVKLAGGLKLSDLFSNRTSIRLSRGPIEFLQVIEDASFVLTSSFHATAFAILLDKPFAVLLSGDRGKDSRIIELLKTFSLSDRVVSSSSELNFSRPSSQAETRRVAAALNRVSRDYLISIVDVDS